jgi:hypothetical protein
LLLPFFPAPGTSVGDFSVFASHTTEGSKKKRWEEKKHQPLEEERKVETTMRTIWTSLTAILVAGLIGTSSAEAGKGAGKFGGGKSFPGKVIGKPGPGKVIGKSMPGRYRWYGQFSSRRWHRGLRGYVFWSPNRHCWCRWDRGRHCWFSCTSPGGDDGSLDNPPDDGPPDDGTSDDGNGSPGDGTPDDGSPGDDGQ